jgi:hypothetical protein
MISSSEKSTAAIGVLNAAASAADAPTGMSQRTWAVLRPTRRATTDAMPAPMCTDGPSRPSAMPLANDVAQQRNLPNTVRRVMRPSWTKIAARVCGMPLPRASGKYRTIRNPVTSAPNVGTRMRRHPAPPAGYMCATRRPVSRMNATTTRPTSAPMMRLSTRARRSSLRRRSSTSSTRRSVHRRMPAPDTTAPPVMLRCTFGRARPPARREKGFPLSSN